MAAIDNGHADAIAEDAKRKRHPEEETCHRNNSMPDSGCRANFGPLSRPLRTLELF
jgi:hypothetical protein